MDTGFRWQMGMAVMVVAACLTTPARAATTLRLLGQASLPTGGPPKPGTEQVAFDDLEKVAYLVGDKQLYVIDMSPEALLDDGAAAAIPRPLEVLHTMNLTLTVNDVAFCGGYVAISSNSATKVLPGTVTIFNRYLRHNGERRNGDQYVARPGAGSLEQLAQFTVGALPDQLVFSQDCRTILTSNEGEPLTYTPASLANDPEGSVSVINLYFCDGVDGQGYVSNEAEDDRATAAGGVDTEAYRHLKGRRIPPRNGYKRQPDSKKADYDHSYNHQQKPSYAGHPREEPYYVDHSYKAPDNAYDEDPGPHYNRAHHGDNAHDASCQNVRVFGNVRSAGFTAWNDKSSQLLAMGVKLNGVNATVAQDLEPECTSFSEDEKIAFVSLQENNAVAVLDVEKAIITNIYGLGFKDHNASANPLDASDRDGPSINIKTWPVNGMYQPDEIKSFRYKNADYLVTANEGDARADWPGLNEESRVRTLRPKLNTTVFGDPNVIGAENNLGRLNVLSVNGNPYPPFSDPQGTGNFSKLFSFGARSFSIWKLQVPSGDEVARASFVQVFDSAAQLELISKDQLFDIWNSELGNVGNSSWDQRSDNKGPEPEGVAVGPCGGDYHVRQRQGSSKVIWPPVRSDRGRQNDLEDEYEPASSPGDAQRLCLFLGTERLGAVYVYDITDPSQPVFQSVARPPTAGPGGLPLSAPEGITYARYSMGSRSFPVVMVAYEASDSNSTLPTGLGVYMVADE